MARAKKRADGNYCVTLVIGRDENGKSKRKFFYSRISRADAMAKRDEWTQTHEFNEPEAVENLDKLTVREWSARWMAAYKSGMSNNGKLSYKSCCNRICEFVFASGVTFGDMLLQDVKPLHINEYVNSLKGMSKSTIAKARFTLKQLFDTAEDNGFINVIPTRRIQKVKGTYNGHKALSREEVDLIGKNWGKHWYGLPVMMMMWAGLRKSECCALKWENIDLKNDVIRVVESRDLIVAEDKEPKTEAGKREVPVFPPLSVALRSVPEADRHGYFCKNRMGQPMKGNCPDSSLRSFLRIFSDEDKPIVFTAHDLRTTFVTLCYDAKVDVLTTAKWVGHEDIKTTLEIYTKLSQERRKESTDEMLRFIEKITNAR